jgi:hypothetical protein
MDQTAVFSLSLAYRCTQCFGISPVSPMLSLVDSVSPRTFQLGLDLEYLQGEPFISHHNYQ